MAQKAWSDLSDRQKTAIRVAISVQVSLLLTALTDIYRYLALPMVSAA